MIRRLKQLFEVDVLNVVDNPWFNKECINKRTNYRRARGKYRRSKSDIDKTLVDQACKKYKNTMKLARKEYTKKQTETVRRLRKSKPQEYWKLLNPKQKRVCDVSLESSDKHIENMQNINLEDGITDNDTCINEHINISNDVLDMYFTEADVKKV